MGRRVDAIVIYRGILFVLEYKVGEADFSTSAIDQAVGYALDLKNFHEASHDRTIVPIVVATRGADHAYEFTLAADGVAGPLCTNGQKLAHLISECASRWEGSQLDAHEWSRGRYKPTPTIIEAAQALYAKHDVLEISRSEAGAENLTVTAKYIGGIIDEAKKNDTKCILFLTGVPGSGKTLAGLNIANQRMKAQDDEHGVFLSGNGPLVKVLREALVQDALRQPLVVEAQPRSRAVEQRNAEAFIQNIHHFRDDNLGTDQPPINRAVLFDEAQRAWNVERLREFMKQRHGIANFNMSEPAYLLSVMDRRRGWCCVVCLVGEGQEIGRGEAGISEWFDALQEGFPDWQMHLSPDVIERTSAEVTERKSAAKALVDSGRAVRALALHLSVSIRSFRAERLSEFVGAVIEGQACTAREIASALGHFDLRITRDLGRAREWVRQKRRGTERAGLLASSNALRLKPHGIHVKVEIDPALWFLAPREDVRSSDALEDVATEFDVQGLELDWACVCWDANFRRSADNWGCYAFRGTKWQSVRDPYRQSYIANTYRVLLTRARQGMVIFVSHGDANDKTRPASFYDGTYDFLVACGLRPLEADYSP